MGTRRNGKGVDWPLAALAVSEHDQNVLARWVRIETRVPARVEVETTRDGEVLRSRESRGAATTHEVLVVGFHAGSEHELIVRATAEGETAVATRNVSTAPLPDDVPPVHVRQSDPERAAEGYRLVSLVRWERTHEPTHRPDRDWGMALALDARGRIVWYYRADHPIWGATPTPSGTLVYNSAPNAVVEIDMAGRVVGEWRADRDLGRRIEDGTFGLHHGVHPLDSGGFLALSTEKRTVPGYRSSEEATDVVGDVALEFVRTGDVVDSWSMFDILRDHRTRRRETSTRGYWDREYGQRVEDWTHGNTVIPGDTPGTLVASLRHQDWIVKWDRQTGELIWRFGPEGDFEFPEGTDGEWFYHQHAPTWTEEGHLLVYDNGNTRPRFSPGNVPTTRVAEYRFDASDIDRAVGETGTVREVWSVAYPSAFYAPYVGDLDVLPNDGVLVGDGGLLEHPEACVDGDSAGSPIRKQTNQKWARMHEFRRGAPRDRALEVWIRDSSRREPRSYTMQGCRYLSELPLVCSTLPD